MNKKLILFGVLLLILVFSVSYVSAEKINDNSTIFEDSFNAEVNLEVDIDSSNDDFNSNNILGDSSSQEELKDTGSDEIIVNDWNELQYYCSLSDKDYTLRLKENTNYYPTNVKDSNYQIKINNNIKIIGSNGSYIGDSTPYGGVYHESDSRYITYIPIIVEGTAIDVILENITFKWIHTFKQPDSIVIQLYSGGTTLIKGCTFDTIDTILGAGSVVHLKKGEAVLENCSFVNNNVPKACIMVSEGQEMIMRDCYFYNNYGNEHSTCGMNWGTLAMYNTKFYKNRSVAWAGGITTYGAGITNIYNYTFADNVAGWNG